MSDTDIRTVSREPGPFLRDYASRLDVLPDTRSIVDTVALAHLAYEASEGLSDGAPGIGAVATARRVAMECAPLVSPGRSTRSILVASNDQVAEWLEEMGDALWSASRSGFRLLVPRDTWVAYCRNTYAAAYGMHSDARSVDWGVLADRVERDHGYARVTFDGRVFLFGGA